MNVELFSKTCNRICFFSLCELFEFAVLCCAMPYEVSIYTLFRAQGEWRIRLSFCLPLTTEYTINELIMRTNCTQVDY